MKGYLVIENFHPSLEPMSGNLCTFFIDKKKAEQRFGTYKRNQHVQIIEVDLKLIENQKVGKVE